MADVSSASILNHTHTLCLGLNGNSAPSALGGFGYVASQSIQAGKLIFARKEVRIFMAEIIEIKNGLVTLIEQSLVKQISLRTFKEELLSTLGAQTPILPRNTVLFAQKEDTRLYVLEQLPCSEIIHYKPERARQPRQYTLPVPYAYFVCKFVLYALENLYIYFSPKPLSDKSDMLYYPPLPNCFEEGRVCLGDYRFSVTSSIPSKITSVVDYFWKSNFNQEASYLYENMMPREIKDATESEEIYFDSWARIAPEKICQLSWKKYKGVEEVIADVLDSEED